VLHALGELHETALAAPGRAVDAYEKAAALDPGADDHLVALERLHRRAEDLGQAGRRPRAARRAGRGRGGSGAGGAAAQELAQLRSEKLGDVEGAIERWRAAVEANPRDLDALRALAQLYERTGDGEAHRETLEKLAEAGPDGERAVILRRLAAEVEDREGGAARAIRWYERVAALEPGAATCSAPSSGSTAPNIAGRRWSR
jgi:tetratricopeptide (TPR) repeat protein